MHWYDKEGNPQHFMAGKNGKERATTLRDARKLNYAPSVTEILNVADKPALTMWKVKQAYLSCLTLPKVAGESVDDFMRRAKKDASEESIKARDLGSDIHNQIERAFLGKPYQHAKAVEATLEAVYNLTGIKDGWRPEETFFHESGFGGMCDLHHPEGWVIDFKTKDFGKDDKVKGYPEQLMQLSAYSVGLFGDDTAMKANIFISRDNPGVVDAWDWDSESNYEMFGCLLKYWQLSKNYKPEI